nr:reverse transcriptase domain-containing protein [Tanacetum cinerariifolium]
MKDLKQQYLNEMKRLVNSEYRDEIKIDELKGNFNRMSIEINKKEKLQQLEQVANLSTYPSKSFNSFCYDDDDDKDYTVVITTDFPITDSLIMENEHLDTIPETESDEFIKSSVENLVLIPRINKANYDPEEDIHLVERLFIPENVKTHAKGFCTPFFISSASIGNHEQFSSGKSSLMDDKQKLDVLIDGHDQRSYSRYTEVLSESEDSEGGHWKSRSKRNKSSREEDDLSQPWVCKEIDPFTSRIRYFDFPNTRMPSHIMTYDRSEDPEDHLKIFQAATKTERWAMPTWCHMANKERERFWNQPRPEKKQDRFTLLTNTPKEIFALEKGKFKAPPPMKTPIEKRNHAKFCEFHRKEQPKAAKKGETSGKDKALAILMVQPWERVARKKITQSFSFNLEIFFPPLEEDEGIEGPMIIEAKIGGHCIHRMYVDATTPLVGFSDEIIWSIGKIQLLVKIKDEEHSTVVWMNFVVVRSPSSYNEVIGRSGVRKLQAVSSTTQGMLKLLKEGGGIILKSSRLVPLECAMVFKPERNLSVTKEIMEERVTVAINPEYVKQTVLIGSTLSEEGRNKLCDLLQCNLLQRNLDIKQTVLIGSTLSEVYTLENVVPARTTAGHPPCKDPPMEYSKIVPQSERKN